MLGEIKKVIKSQHQNMSELLCICNSCHTPLIKYMDNYADNEKLICTQCNSTSVDVIRIKYLEVLG